MTFSKIERAISDARLHELYWREGRTPKEIGEITQTSEMTARRWLIAAGITLRTKSEAKIVRAARASAEEIDQRRRHLDQARNTRWSDPEQRAKLAREASWNDKRHQKRAHRIGIKKRKETGYQTRLCARCDKPVTRTNNHYENPPDRTYCGHSCAAKAGWERRRATSGETLS